MEADAEPFADDLPPVFADRWENLTEAAMEALEFAYQAVLEAEDSLLHRAESMREMRYEAEQGTGPKVTLAIEAAYRAERAVMLMGISLATSQAVASVVACETYVLAHPEPSGEDDGPR